MQKLKFLPLLLLFPLALLAQEKAKTETTQSSFGFTFAPEYNWARMGFNPYSVSTSIGLQVQGLFGFSASANYMYSINERLSLRTGLGFGIKRCVFETSGLSFEDQYDPVTQSFVGRGATMKDKYQFLELQLPTAIQIIHPNKRIYLDAGIEMAYIFKNSSQGTIEYKDGENEKLSIKQHNSSLNFAPTFGIGYRVFYQGSTTLSVQPTMKYYLVNYGTEKYQEAGLVNFSLAAVLYF